MTLGYMYVIDTKCRIKSGILKHRYKFVIKFNHMLVASWPFQFDLM